MACNLYSYFRMAGVEHFIERFCDFEQLCEDLVVRHSPDGPHSSNTLGVLPPRTYFRFDKGATEAEFMQAYAYGQPIPAVP